ncbi:MAG: hypothetical protein ACKKL6_03575 [Candidatus Komeilibacteria bacterium]
MNNQNSQQNSQFMSVYAKAKSLLRKVGYVCAPTIDNSQAQADYFVVSDYDGLQLNSN